MGTESNNNVVVPRWVFILFIGLMFNGIAVVFSAGSVFKQVQELTRRVGNIESQMYILLGK